MKIKLPAWFARTNTSEPLTVADAQARADQAHSDLDAAGRSEEELRAKFIETRDATLLEEIEATHANIRRLELLVQVVDNELVSAKDAAAAAARAAKEARLAEVQRILAEKSEEKRLEQAEVEALKGVIAVRLKRFEQLSETRTLETEVESLRFELGIDKEYGGGRGITFYAYSHEPKPYAIAEALRELMGGNPTNSNECRILAKFASALERFEI